MTRFVFREPFDRCGQSFIAGILAFGLGHPLEILTSFAWWKTIECFRARAFFFNAANPRVLALWDKVFAACDCVPLKTVPEAETMFADFEPIAD